MKCAVCDRWADDSMYRGTNWRIVAVSSFAGVTISGACATWQVVDNPADNLVMAAD
jgi:hypothetical protein